MIKFRGTKEDRRILGFGLSRGNIDRLTAGQPIHLWLDEMGVAKTDLLIFFGETEEKMAKELAKQGFITQEDIDKAHIDPKLRS